MKGLTKVRGIATEDIIAFLVSNGIPHEVKSCPSVQVKHRDGYAKTVDTFAFKSRITLHPSNRNRVEAEFPREHDHHYAYQAFYKIDNPEGLGNVSGLVKLVDGLVVVDTVLDGTINYPI